MRSLKKNPGFATVAVLSLALGIGANVAIFSIYSSFFLSPPPLAEPDRLVEIYTNDSSDSDDFYYSVSSYPDYVDMAERTTDAFDGVVIYSLALTILQGEQESEYLIGERVSGNYFDVLGIQPVLGRAFSKEEGEIGASPTAVIAYRFWQSHYGGDPDIIGKTIPLSGYDFTIIGVAPEEYTGLYPLVTNVWYPITLTPLITPGSSLLDQRISRQLLIKGRLKDGVTFEQAESTLLTFSASQAELFPESHADITFLALPTKDVVLNPMFDAPIKTFTFFLMGIVGLVLLIACTNLASMLLARASSRRREIGIRLAIGANRIRLIRQLLTESITLSLMGGIAGLALAWWIIRLLLAFQPPIAFPMEIDISMNGQVFAFALFLSLITGIVFGLLPSWQTTKLELVSALKDAYGSTGGRLSRFGIRNSLVVAQVAVSALLLVFAGLFMRSLGNASSIDPGFDIRQGVVATFELREQGFDLEKSNLFYSDLISRTESLPGVESASFVDVVPLGAAISMTSVYPQTPHVKIDEDGVSVDFATVSPNYFGTMGIPVLAGRAFNEQDVAGGNPVTIINETMANRYWPGESAIGQQILRQFNTRDDEYYTVIGIARDGRYRTLGEEQRPYFYRPNTQEFSGFTNLVVRTSVSGNELLLQVREQVRAIDSHLPILGIITMSEHLELMLFIPRLVAGLLFSLGFLSLILGTIGLYGIISYDVSRRTREVGIRMSLGAQQSKVLRLIISDGLKLVLVGAVIGLGISFLTTRFLATMLFGISPVDTMTFIGVFLLFLVVAFAATYMPAKRASDINPVEALRYE